MKRKFFGFLTLIALSAAVFTFTACGNKTDNNDGLTVTDCVFSSFVAEDFDGNIVDETVFAEHKITLINVWATFCPPCIKEVPELAELNADYADKGFQVIGILVDENRSTPINAKQLAEDTGANYRQLKISGSVKTFIGGITAYPHTVFVNAEGRQIGSPYTGAKSKADWKKIIDEMIKFTDGTSNSNV